MLRKRIEKLEAHLPMASARLLERLDRQALNQLSGSDRSLVTQMLAASVRHRHWPADCRAAETRYLDNFGVLLQEITDSELAGLILQIESELRWPLTGLETTT